MTPVIPTNDEPTQRDAGAKAGAEAVATWPETELRMTARAAEDLYRDAAGLDFHRVAEAPVSPAERIAAAFAIGHAGRHRSHSGQGRVRWVDESDSDNEWLGHEANVPSVRDVRIARSALRYCVKRDASRAFVNSCQAVVFQQLVDQPKESNVGSTHILDSNRVEGCRKRVQVDLGVG